MSNPRQCDIHEWLVPPLLVQVFLALRIAIAAIL